MVDAVTEQVEIEVAATGLLDHHPFWKGDQTHRRDGGILQQRLDLLETLEEPFDVIHGGGVGKFDSPHSLGHGAQHPDRELLHRKDPFHPPGEQLRELEQRQGLTGGGQIQDDAVVVAGVGQLVDPQ